VGGGGVDSITVANYFYDISGNMLRESDDARQDQYYYYGSNRLICKFDSKMGVMHSYVRTGLQLHSSSDGFYFIADGRGDVVALVSTKAITYYNSGDIDASPANWTVPARIFARFRMISQFFNYAASGVLSFSA
jgi:mannose-6-phosphate isomerase-like protein (cupin superfamily)